MLLRRRGRDRAQPSSAPLSDDSPHLDGHALLVTTDAGLARDVQRLAAAAGARVVHVGEPGAAAPSLARAAVVLLGADLAHALVGRELARRPRVHLLTDAAADERMLRVALQLGVASVLELPRAEPTLLELLADAADGRAQAARTIAVVGGSGGAGASSLAVALAGAAAEAADTALLDLDPLGPDLRRAAGWPTAGMTWREIADAHGRLAARDLREAMPREGRLGILGWPEQGARLPGPDQVRAVVSAARRGHAWVVLDLPRSLPRAVWPAVEQSSRAVLLVRGTVGGVAAAARVAERLREGPSPVGIVVRRRGHDVAEEVAAVLGLPLWGSLRDQRRLDEHLDLGLGPTALSRSPLARTARALLADTEQA